MSSPALSNLNFFQLFPQASRYSLCKPIKLRWHLMSQNAFIPSVFSPGKLPRTAPLLKPEYPQNRFNEDCFHQHYFYSPVMKYGIFSFNFQHLMTED